MKGITATVLALGLAVACSSAPVQEAGIPGTSAPATIALLGERGPDYLDVLVTTAGKEWRFFVPPSEGCHALIAQGQARYYQNGPLGSLRNEDGLRCDPNGILSLQQWRDRTSRARPPGTPSGQAQYTIIYRDGVLALALGRFPKVGYLGWTGGDRTVAVIPAIDECEELLGRQVATIEYRASGKVPLALLASDGRCPLLGLARPN